MILRPRAKLLPTLALALAVLAPLALGACTTARAKGEPAVLIAEAGGVLDNFLQGPLREQVTPFVRNAYGVLIVPEVIQAGAVLGAEHGLGVMFTRDIATGEWRGPAFFDVYGGSLGLQAGVRLSDVVLTVMNPDAVDRLVSNRVRLGAETGLSIGRVGAGVGAATTANLGEDVYVFAHNRGGLYGGVSVEGSVLSPREDWTNAYFGRPVETAPVLRGEIPPPSSAQELKTALAQF